MWGSSGSHFGVIWKSFGGSSGVDFWIIWGAFAGHVRINWESSAGYSGCLFGSAGDRLGCISGSSMGHLESILGQGGTLIGGSTFNHESPKSNCLVSLAPRTVGFHSSANCCFFRF